MLLFLCILLFLLMTLVLSRLFTRVGKERSDIQRRLHSLTRERIREELAEVEESEKQDTFKDRFVAPFLLNLRQLVDKNMGKQRQIKLEKKLFEAGSPFRLKAVDFQLAQIAIASLTFVVFLVLFAFGSEEPFTGIMFAMIAGIFAAVYPQLYLNGKKKGRIKRIEKEMPDFFDMVNVSIEAGMGLDGAVKRVCTQMKSPLAEEFRFALEDMKLGKTRKQAFEELRDRIPSEFFKSVLNSIIQADQMGIGMTKVLRAQTERMREQKKQTVKEQAMKAPVKMLIPMVLFIFPTLFIILLGPVIINLVTKWL